MIGFRFDRQSTVLQSTGFSSQGIFAIAPSLFDCLFFVNPIHLGTPFCIGN